jgi:tetratricopeptide (TPR) repeat protein
MTLWFFVALAPVSGIMGTVNGDHAYADRYTYVPFVGVTAIGAVLAAHCKRCVLRCLAAVSVVVIVLESWYAIEVVRSFENDYKAFSRTLERDTDHWRALRVVGNEYCARIGRIDDGVQMLERSLLLRPSQHTAESLAYVLSIRGADGDFERVRVLCAGVSKSPAKDHHGMMLDALGNVCFREGKDADAVGFYNASLKADRRNYSSWHTEFNLALVLANCGRMQESMLLLSRLKASGDVGVRASCARVILQLKSGLGTRFVWNADPFALPAMQ